VFAVPYIELTRGKQALVSDEDFERLSKIKWHAHHDMTSGLWRACRHVPKTRRQTVEMSVDVLGKKEGFVIDHKNRDTLDYRRENLRWATPQQNCRNRIRRNKSGQLPGVWKSNGGFSSRITIEKGVRKFLGYFKTAEEASSAYRNACNKYFGEFSPYTHAV
jgi:hypothetical protein